MENLLANAQVHAHSLVRVLLILILSCCLGYCYSQQNIGETGTSKKATKLYEKAKDAFMARDYGTGLAKLNKAIKVDPGFAHAYLLLANVRNNLGLVDSAYSSYQAYLSVAKNPKPAVIIKVASMALDRGQYDLLGNYLEKYIGQKGEVTPEFRLLSDSYTLINSQNFDATLPINPISDAINCFKLQYLPCFTVDRNTIIYTKRNFIEGDEDLVISKRENGVWQVPKSLSRNINSRSNEGAPTISADGKTLIFTSCDRKDSYGSCDLYISVKKGDNWTKPRNLGKPVNTRYWESQPSLSADGRTLYFTSSRPGGQGGRDIWKTELTDGKWSEPVNPGGRINSFKDESTPFIHQNGKVLFYSSNGMPGLGGYDIFQVELNDTSSLPSNLGYPINTFRDEVALTFSADGSKGFFSKELQKGYEILESKIMEFHVPDSIHLDPAYYLTGRILDSLTQTGIAACVEIVSITKNRTLYTGKSDSLTGEYLVVLPTYDSLAFFIEKEGYLFEDLSFYSRKNDINDLDTLDIILKPIEKGQTAVLNNIYFDTDSYTLDSRSVAELKKLSNFLKQNPAIQLRIEGYTDNTGLDAYNLRLSTKRAKAVFDALLVNGIARERLGYKGYGSKHPIKPNDSASNRQANRRIQFRIL